MKIDVHHHFLPDTLMEHFRKHGDKFNIQIIERDGVEYINHKEGIVHPNFKGYSDYDEITKDLDKIGVDKAILSIAPSCFFYWIDKNDALTSSKICNDWICDFAKKHPDRIGAMATAPMQDVPMALKELQRAHEELGINALEITPIIEGDTLDEEKFFPVYEYCESNHILICLHPSITSEKELYHLKKYYNTNLVGNIYHTNLGINHLIFGGVFEKYPELKVLTSHAGGYFPYQLGRLMHGYQVRGEPKVAIKKSPEHYLDNIYFDTITHWVPALQFLVDNYGANHVMIGTDYPYDMGDYEPVQKVDALKITEDQRQQIYHTNAEKILGLCCSGEA